MDMIISKVKKKDLSPPPKKKKMTPKMNNEKEKCMRLGVENQESIFHRKKKC